VFDIIRCYRSKAQRIEQLLSHTKSNEQTHSRRRNQLVIFLGVGTLIHQLISCSKQFNFLKVSATLRLPICLCELASKPDMWPTIVTFDAKTVAKCINQYC